MIDRPQTVRGLRPRRVVPGGGYTWIPPGLRLPRNSGQMGNADRTGTGQTARLLAAGALVAAGRCGRDRRCALLDEPRGLDADAAVLGAIPGALRPAARPGVPADMAAGSAPHSLGDGGGARRGDGAAGGGTVRPAGDSRLGVRDRPPGLGGVVVACRAELKPAGGGPAAQQGGIRQTLPPRSGLTPAGRRQDDGCTCRGVTPTL